MHISSKTEYAVRAMSELAISAAERPVSITEICNKQKLPRKYVEQLFRNLKKSGLVQSKHGSLGGYFLNKPIENISLQNIMEAVDESYVRKFCTEEHHKDHCIGFPCGFHELWDEIKEHLDGYFDSIKLDQIIAKL